MMTEIADHFIDVYKMVDADLSMRELGEKMPVGED
jgi:hypothetical protein